MWSPLAYRRFLRDLRKLLRAGVPVREALGRLAGGGTGDSPAREVLEALQTKGGLAEALGSLRRVPPEDIAWLAAAERSGTLVETLDELIQELDRRAEERRALIKRLAYPVTVCLLAVVLPPLYLVAAGRVGDYLAIEAAVFVPLAVLVALFVLAARKSRASPAWKRRVEALLLSVPFARGMRLDYALGRTFRLLGRLLGAGLGFGEALPLAAEASPSPSVAEALEKASQALERGAALSEAFAALPGLLPYEKVRLAAASMDGLPHRAFLELAEERNRRFASKWTAVTRTVPYVLILVAATVVLLQGLRLVEQALNP